jgi:hypothetical protein
MNKKQSVIVIAIIAMLTFLTVQALTTWSKTFTWQQQTKSFQVYVDESLTTPWTAGNEPLGPITDPTTKTFYIDNTGTVTVTVTVTGESITGGTATWNPSSKSITLGYATYGTMTLTLSTFTQTDCSYTFTFTAS